MATRQPYGGLSEADFDLKVKQIRARGIRPAVIPKPYNKKALATPEQWAGQLEYDAIKRRRWRAGLTKPQRVQYKKGHTWVDEVSGTSNTAVQDSEQRPVGTQGRVHECVLVQCSCGSEPRWVPVGELNHSDPKKRLRGCQKCKGEAITARALGEFPSHSVGETIGQRTVVAVGEIEQKRNGENIRFDQRMKLRCECGTEDDVWHSSLHAVSDKCRFCIANDNIERVPIGTTYGDSITALTTLSEPYFSDAVPIAPSKRDVQVRTLVVDVQCSCPEETVFPARLASLKSGNTKSCGCRQSLVTSKRNVAEDQASKPLTCRWLYRSDDLEILMRSSWELAAAYYLDEIGIDWEYEKQWFTLADNIRYCPDFYLPATQEWIEVKSDHLLERFSKKAQAFSQLGEGMKLTVWSSKELKEKTGLDANGIIRKYASHRVLFGKSGAENAE